MIRLVVVTVIGLFIFFEGNCQVKPATPSVVSSFPLEICFNKTTNLIFPYPMRSIDRGSQDIIVQKAKGVDNVLQVKANREGFTETNISVITSDGRFYSFLVNYESSPRKLNWSFAPDSGQQLRCKLADGEPNDEEVMQFSQKAANSPKFMHVRRTVERLQATVTSIYLKAPMMLLVLELKNRSLVDWTGGSCRLFVCNRHVPKRSALQEREVAIVGQQPDLSVVGNGTNRVVIPFSGLTIGPSEMLVLRINERQGGRTVELRIRARQLLRARVLPE